jgi:hypothetical protein
MSASAPSQTVFSIGYDFHLGNGNNGNVFGITNYKDNSRNQSFTYDSLSRLTSAQNTGTNCAAMTVNNRTEYWGNSYGYDAWGNLLQVVDAIEEFASAHPEVVAGVAGPLVASATPAVAAAGPTGLFVAAVGATVGVPLYAGSQNGPPTTDLDIAMSEGWVSPDAHLSTQQPQTQTQNGQTQET